MSLFPQVSGHQSVCSFVYFSILISILCIIRIRCLSALDYGLVGSSDSIKLVKPSELSKLVGSSDLSDHEPVGHLTYVNRLGHLT